MPNGNSPNGEAVHPPLANGGWAERHRLHCLELRTGPEGPEGNLRELTWDGKPDCGIATTHKAVT